MSRFYVEVQGTAKMVSRTGNAASGIWAHIRGWDVGVVVNIYVDGYGRDVIRIGRTGGSNAPTVVEMIAVIEDHKESS